MDITADNANQIIAEVASGTSLTDFKSRIDVTRDGATVSDDEMEKSISEQQNYKPVSETDIAAIREQILKARITEIPEGTKFVEDEKDNCEWVKKQNEWNDKVRKEVAEMPDEDVLAWARDANERFHGVIEIQKKDFETFKGGKKFTEELTQDKDPKWELKTDDQKRRHFLRITNPKRKRGDPISKEPKAFQRMLRQCKFIREKMDFDHMSKLELRTRLIQTIAIASINMSDLMERHENQMNLMRESYNELRETLEKTRAELKDSVVHKIPDK